jgi:hypothetical protein
MSHWPIGRRTRGAMAAAASLLVATSVAGLATPARAASASFYVSYANGDALVLSDTGTPNGFVSLTDLGFPEINGTNPSLAPVEASEGNGNYVNYQVAAVSTYNRLYLDPWLPANEGDGAEGVVYDDTTLPLASGTSAAVTYNLATADSPFTFIYNPASTPWYVDAWNSGESWNTNHLLLMANDPIQGGQDIIDSGLLMASGASPAITSDTNTTQPEPGGGYVTSELGQIAFQGSNGDLWDDQWGGGFSPTTSGFDTGQAMASGTNPSITAYNYDTVATGFATAIHGTNGDALVNYQVYSNAGAIGFTIDTLATMAPGASPAIAYDGTTSLYNSSSSNGAHVEVAFRGTDGNLLIWNGSTDTTTDTGVAISPNTNPAIAFINGGYEVALHGTNGDLWIYNSLYQGIDTDLGMGSGSSPAL